MKYSHVIFLHSKLSLKLQVFTHPPQTLASSNQRTFIISVEIIYSFNLFTRNHKNKSNLLVISLLTIEILTLYPTLLLSVLSLMKREALKTAGPEIHRCVNKIGHDSL